MSPITLKAIRDLALKFEKTNNIQTAFELMELAYKERPEGKLIKRKYIAYGKILERSEILVLGDSHAKVFLDPKLGIRDYLFTVISVAGATISGLENPNSVSQAQPIFEKAMKNTRAKIYITLLGEVDAGFLIWYRAQKYNLEVNEILDQTVSNYINFIDSIPHDKNVIIVGAPLPTIQDGQDWGDVANARKEVKASQLDRTNLTLQLNQRMESYAKKSGVLFVNLDSESLGSDGLVDKKLLNEGRLDHHYSNDEYIKILKPKLVKQIEKIVSGNVPLRRSITQESA